MHHNSTECPDGGIGRRAGLKHQWSKIHPGSTPGLGTYEVKAKSLIVQCLAFSYFIRIYERNLGLPDYQ